MLKKTIPYTDYDGNKRDETFWFNLNKAELTEMNLRAGGSMEPMLNKILETKDTNKMVDIIKDLIHKSYGEKSADGKRFVKTEELADAFFQTEAYSELFIELLSDPDKLQEFLLGVVPENVRAALTDKMTTASETLPTA